MLYDDTPIPTSLPLKRGELLGDRYRIEVHIGGGGFGVVFRALDTVTRGTVAVKVLTGTVDLQDVRREVVALRALRLPGVLQLLDQGFHRGIPYLVTALVDGAHFPGPFTHQTWHVLAPLAAQLLRIVAHIHAAGAIHLDLKPENILVDARGAVTVLDLGLATGPALGATAHQRSAGSVMWAAPEVQYGEAGTAKSDVFSVGKMLNHFVSACPPEVQAVLDQMRSMPRRRPTAWEALERLGIAPALSLPSQGGLQRSSVRATIQTDDVRAREDLLQQLFGRRSVVPHAEAQETVDHWIRTGTLVKEPNSTVAGLGRWRVFPTPARALVESKPMVNVSRVETLRAMGRHREALELACVSLRDRVEPRYERRLVRTLTLSALALRDGHSINEALFQLGRAHTPAPALERLAQAALHAREASRVRLELEAITVVDDDVLSVQAVELLLLSTDSTESDVFDRFDRIAEEGRFPRLSARLLDWQGRRAWLAGTYEQAAVLYLRSARQAPCVEDQLRSWINGIDALIESGAYGAAMEHAERLYRLAKGVQHAAYMVRAVWMYRNAARRAGCWVVPHVELIDAFEAFGDRHYTGLVALYEAIACWQSERLKMGHTLARRAVVNLSPIDRSIADAAATLASAVAAVTVVTPMGLDALAEHALTQRWSDIDWQVLGIIASVPMGAAWRADAQRLAKAAPDPERRREVFSPQQVLDGYVAPNWRWRL
jgi:hypothetical protein